MTHTPADIQDVLDCMTGDTVNDIAGLEAFERILADLATHEFDRDAIAKVWKQKAEEAIRLGRVLTADEELDIILEAAANNPAALATPTPHAAELEKVRDLAIECKNLNSMDRPVHCREAVDEIIAILTAIIEKKGV